MKNIKNRISRASGHLEAIGKMVEDGRDCCDVLNQLHAVKAAINSISRIIVKSHFDHCLVQAMEKGDKDALSRIGKALDTILK